MSKNRNYTNYSKANKPAEPAATETPEDQTPQSNENIQNLQETPVATETVTDTTNTITEPQPDPEDQTPQPEPDLPKAVFGTVVNCAKLNIRAEPNKAAEVLCVINKGEEVEVFEELSTDDFYAVIFGKDKSVSIEGYCMKQYIEINN